MLTPDDGEVNCAESGKQMGDVMSDARFTVRLIVHSINFVPFVRGKRI